MQSEQFQMVQEKVTELIDMARPHAIEYMDKARPHLNFKEFGEALQVNTNFSNVRMWDEYFLLIPAYIVCVAVLQWLYTDKAGNPVSSVLPWKPLMVLYNLCMTGFSFYTFFFTAKVMSENELYTSNCGLFFSNDLFKNLVYYFYISKYIEFADTLFLIVKGKKVSYLHWIHHIGAALDMGFVYLSNFEAAWIFLLLNGFIHTIMYFYYTCALLKIRLPGKSIITSMQIVQFLVGLSFVWNYKHIPCSAEDADQMFAWVYNFAYIFVILSLFVNFYVQTYVLGPKKKKSQKKKTA